MPRLAETGQFCGQNRDGLVSMSEHFGQLDGKKLPVFENGTVWLAGAGPGGPGLLTLLAYHGLGQADVIVHDALVPQAILDLAPSGTERVFAGKRGGKPSPKQADITLTIIERARAGQKVLRLKGGDPFMFGRGGEEAIALFHAGIKFRIVPGISSGLGGLAYAGIPATHRDINHAVIFLTGHDESGAVPHSVDWEAIATAAPVIVMFMAIKHLHSIAARLIAAGRAPDDPLAIVSHVALPTQRVVTTRLGDAQALNVAEIATPALVVLGAVTNLRTMIDWYKPEGPADDFG